jgi:integrase
MVTGHGGSSGMITFREFYQREAERLWSGKHLRESKSKMAKFSDFNGYGERRLDDFKPADLYAYLDHVGERFTDNTVNHYAAAISVVFNHAVEMELITHAPKVKWRKVKTGRPRYLTDDEYAQLREFLANDRNWWMEHFVIIGMNTGMRLGEIRQIGRKAFLSEDKQWLTLPETKNGDERIIPISVETLAAIEALGGRPEDHYSHRKFYRCWGKARRKIAQGDKTFVFHTLRHTCATTMANDLQVNSILIGQMLGHRSEQTTRKYIHAKPQNLLNIAQKLSKRSK